MKEFPIEIKLKDSWFEGKYNKLQQLLVEYRKQRRKLEDIQHEATKPIPCKSWTKCYHYGDEPEHLASMWAEINDYIKEHSIKEGWTYSHIETTKVDVNTDPYDDYEHLTDMYTVYAIVENGEDFRESEEYCKQEDVVRQLYNECMQLKDKIDKKLKGEGI